MKRDSAPAVHFATTSHGLGHIARMLAVLRSLHEKAPDCQLHVSTTASPDWLQSQLDFDVVWRNASYEPGVVQPSCFDVDVASTLDTYARFEHERPERLRAECDYLNSHNFIGVVSDIPALAVRAAHDVGLPAIGVSNFTWDWILEPWCVRETSITSRLSEDYACGTRQLCLPLGPDSSPFPEQEPAPLIARLATRSPAEVRTLLELEDQRTVLVCPGGWTAEDWPVIAARPGDFQLITVGDLPIDADVPMRRLSHALPAGLALTDVIAAADVVLGKAGYGLASECAVHGVPFAMIDRPGFRETPVLMSKFRAIGRSSSCSVDEFFSGHWEPLLEEAIASEPPGEIERNGANVIANRILDLFDIPRPETPAGVDQVQ